MDRRESLKRLAVGSVGAGLLVQCEPKADKPAAEAVKAPAVTIDRTPEELAHDQKIQANLLISLPGMPLAPLRSERVKP